MNQSLPAAPSDEQIDKAFREHLQRTHLGNPRQQHRLGALGYAEEEWEGFEAGYRAAFASLAVLVEPAAVIDPKLPAAASILVATLGKVRNKCRPGYVVSKFAADWISEATAIATAINASLAAPAVPLEQKPEQQDHFADASKMIAHQTERVGKFPDAPSGGSGSGSA